MSVQDVLNVLYFVVGLFLALIPHEVAHAVVAARLGDHSAKATGRTKLDPRPHVDPFGTLLLPAILLLPVLFGSQMFFPFAYAKPQPVNRWSLRKPDRDTTLIALAGPVMNVLLAFALGALFRGTGGGGQLTRFLAICLEVNVVFAAIHLIPLPPLDASRIVVRFLPPRAREFYSNMEQYAAIIFLVIFFILPGPINAFIRAVGGGICRLAAGAPC